MANAQYEYDSSDEDEQDLRSLLYKPDNLGVKWPADSELQPSQIAPRHSTRSKVILGAVDIETQSVEEKFVDRKSLTRAQRKTLDETMPLLSPETVSSMPPSSLRWVGTLTKICIFLSATMIFSISSLADQWGVYSSEGGKGIEYIPRMPYNIQYLGSVIFATVLAWSLYGFDGVQRMYTPSRFIQHWVISVSSIVADVASLKAQVEMDAALWKVISQIKLPLTAISSMLILKQHITFTQIFLMTAIAMTIMVYCQKGIKQAVIKDWGNFGIGIFGLVLQVVGGSTTELTFRDFPDRFIIQMGQNRILGFLFSCLATGFEITANNQWHLFPTAGFNRGVWIMLAMEGIKCWSTVLVVKRLDSIFKTLSMNVSLGLTYVLSAFFMRGAPPFEWTQFTLIMLMALNVIAYSLSRRDQSKLVQLRLDAQRRIGENKKH